MKPKFRVAVDTGGTFTDLCLVDDSTGKLAVAKVPSTPSDPAEGVINGIRELMSAAGLQAEEIGFFLHGTTVATNALLEGKGAPTGLITTEGFEDVLLIGRQNRPRLYDFWAKRPKPIVPRSLCYGVPERTLHTGEILRPLDESRVREIIVDIRRKGITSIAVCLLHSYANPVHEQRDQGDHSRCLSGSIRDRFFRYSARVPRIRADEHGLHQRLCHAQGQFLCKTS